MKYDAPTYEDIHYKFICETKHVPPNTRSLLNFHEGIEILYIIEGEGYSHNDGEDIHLDPGDICVISARKLHFFETLSTGCNYFLLMPDASFFSAFGVIPTRYQLAKKIIDPTLEGYLKKIIWEEDKKKKNYRAMQFGLITILIAELLRNYCLDEVENAEKGGKYDLILPVIDYISQNYTQQITSSMLAKKYGISQSYLCHIFSETVGQSITEYVNYLRCSKVRELITTEGYSVSHAAMECGFSNLSYFTRTYKRFFGVLPSQSRPEKLH